MSPEVSMTITQPPSTLSGAKNENCKLKTLGCAILIILCLGSLAAAGVGIASYLQASSLSHLGQINSIILMAVGGGGGILFLSAAMIALIKNCVKERSIATNIPTPTSENSQTSAYRPLIYEKKSSIATNSPEPTSENSQTFAFAYKPLIYGEEEWQKCGIVIHGPVPDMPLEWQEMSFTERCMIIYFPYHISIGNEQHVLTFDNFQRYVRFPNKSHAFYSYDLFTNLDWCKEPVVREAGWKLIPMQAISDSTKLEYSHFREAQGGEIAIAIAMHKICANKAIYKEGYKFSINNDRFLVIKSYDLSGILLQFCGYVTESFNRGVILDL